MKTWQENITVLSISKMYKDKLMLCGVNDENNWRRIVSMSHFDLMNGEKAALKIFGRSSVICYASKTQENGFDLLDDYHFEDCLILNEPKPILLNEIKVEDRNLFVKNQIDGGVEAAFSRNRSVGLIKPLVEQVNFGWDSLFNTFESSFIFQDKTGQRYKFICTDLKWFYSWIYLFQKKRQLLHQQLNELPFQLNKKDTYFVIGLSRPLLEFPGGFRGCWPLILGIHSF